MRFSEEVVVPAVIGACAAMLLGCYGWVMHTRAAAAVAMHKAGADPLDIPCATGEGTERYCEMRAVTKMQAAK